jgi:RNA polymerase sigma factor (sigma-70 family)
MKDNAEQSWVQRAKQGEPVAIAELYRHYWRAARAAAYGVTGDLDLAEDAASEAFYAALDGLGDLKDVQRFVPWLHTIVVRTARRLKAVKSKEKKVELQTLPDNESPAPNVSLEQREMAALIHEAVGNLSESLREAMSLFYFEGYSVEEAARFLDIPVGTLKRRLHDGRNRLRQIAEQILKGTKPVYPKREQLLKRFRDIIDKGKDSKTFHQLMPQIFRLRPLPYDLIAKYLQRHSKIAKVMVTPEGREKVQHRSRKVLEYIGRPSARALDPDHVVCKVAHAIRAALPEFKEWHLDLSQLAQNVVQKFMGNLDQSPLPPGFAEGSGGSYMYISRASLVKSRDGSWKTIYEIMQETEWQDFNDEVFINNGRLSDALILMWMQSDTIELRAIEELLRKLSEVIAPQIPVSFVAYEEPRYQASLRMQFENVSVPAANGGPLNPWPNMSEGVSAASVSIFLEPWATAQSGQVVELIEFSPHLFFEGDAKQ